MLTWLADSSFDIRAAVSVNPANGRKTLRVRNSPLEDFRDLVTWPAEEDFAVLAFAKDGKSIIAKVTILECM